MDPKKYVMNFVQGARRRPNFPDVYEYMFQMLLRDKGQGGLPEDEAELRKMWDEAIKKPQE